MSTTRSRVELYAAIRRDARAGLSGRALERKHRVGWRTVRQALASAWPEQRKSYPPQASKLDPYKGVIDAILRADLDAPRKQRHTAKLHVCPYLTLHIKAYTDKGPLRGLQLPLRFCCGSTVGSDVMIIRC
jgi:hypothetical protein